MEDGVPIRTVEDEAEAELVCGLLRDAGIACGFRVTEAIDSALYGLASDGPQEILVRPEDQVAALAVIADARA